jgi:hypothetical protein
VAGGDLHVAEVDTGIEHRGDEGVWHIEFLEIVGVHGTDRSLDADRFTRRQRG